MRATALVIKKLAALMQAAKRRIYRRSAASYILCLNRKGEGSERPLLALELLTF